MHVTSEPSYSFLDKLKSVVDRSQFGTPVDLDKTYPALVHAPLVINGRATQGVNPNRYKQHGFHFNADNCIACHACESACSEKNHLPPHLAFRKVGYIEGGAYPDFMRLNISMACNHCEDPVCLKGCPTRAYTKYAEYGAVLQDPDICFGCGYCTWVCPYNAPQLDPVKGQVEKCNMCVDRLEQGLKPACVAACLGNALEFGVIEALPSGRDQAKTQIPGFPDPSISRPNIRFQQIRSLPPDFTRTDGQPIHYQRDTQGAADFHVKAREATATRCWGLHQLSSRENPLVVFTLLSQTVIGAFLWLFLWPQYSPTFAAMLAPAWHGMTLASALLLTLIVMQGGALFLTTLHIGKPLRFYRGFNNLRHSWVSREGAALMAFFIFLSAYALIGAFPLLSAWLPPPIANALPTLLGWGASVTGPLALYCMAMIYRIKARPFWNHWHTQAAFFASLFILASTTLGAVFGIVAYHHGASIVASVKPFALGALGGFLLQGIALLGHLRYLMHRGAEAEVSRVKMLTTYGKTYGARWASLAVLTLVASSLAFAEFDSAIALTLSSLLLLGAVVHEIVGRALFYVLVTPTTMPGAFFWNNKYFEQHARQVGLARMPQVGVVPDTHS